MAPGERKKNAETVSSYVMLCLQFACNDDIASVMPSSYK
jgi:hypothetical protein